MQCRLGYNFHIGGLQLTRDHCTVYTHFDFAVIIVLYICMATFLCFFILPSLAMKRIKKKQ